MIETALVVQDAIFSGGPLDGTEFHCIPSMVMCVVEVFGDYVEYERTESRDSGNRVVFALDCLIDQDDDEHAHN